MAYKAFISYSHAADDKLAPALQSALHRFAKPWYRLRALRIFRDKTSLSASPGLWPSIQKALAESEYFLLLASPQSAASVWVQKELEWWFENRSTSKLLILLTDGELAWDRARVTFDWQRTTAVWKGLGDKFQDEPLYVDLRWARSGGKLSIRQGQFRGAILDIAAPLHGKPKDELDGDDIREFRKTRRLTRWAVMTLILLTTLAIGAATIAYRQWRTAEERKDLALSRQLAAQGLLQIDELPDLSLLLSEQSFKFRDTYEARNSLLSTLESQPRLLSMLRGRGEEVETRSMGSDDPRIEQVAFHRDGTRILSLDWGDNLRLWDALTWKPIGEPRRLPREWGNVAFSPNFELAAGALEDKIVLWDVAGWRELASLEHAMGQNGRLAFSSDGSILATGSESGVLALWDIERRTALGPPLTEPNRRGTTLLLSLGPDGAALAFKTIEMSAIQLWDLARRKLSPLQLKADLREAVIASNGAKLAGIEGDRRVSLWSLRDDARKPDYLTEKGNGLATTYECLAASPDGAKLAAGSLGGILALWDLKREEPLPGCPFRAHGAGIKALAFHPDGTKLVSGSDDGTVMLWDADRHHHLATTLHTTQECRDLALSPDGKTLAATDGSKVALWALDARDRPGDSTADGRSPALSLAFSPDGRTLAIGAIGTILFWDLQGQRWIEPRPSSRKHPGARFSAVAFHPDGKRLAAGTTNRRILIWDVERQEVIGKAGEDPDGDDSRDDDRPVKTLAFTPDGRWLLAGGESRGILWDTTQAVPKAVALEGLEATAHALGAAVSADGKLLATSFAEGIVLWDSSSRARLGQMRTPRKEQLYTDDKTDQLVFSPDGSVLVAIHDDGGLFLWDVRTRQLLGRPLRLPQFGRANAGGRLAFSRDGKTLAVTNDSSIDLWDVDPVSWCEQARKLANRRLTAAEQAQFLGEEPAR